MIVQREKCKCCNGTGMQTTKEEFSPGSYYIGTFTIVQSFNKKEPVVVTGRNTWGGVLRDAREMKDKAGGKVKVYEDNKLRKEL